LDSDLTLSLFFESWELFADSVLAGTIAGAVLGFLGVYIILRRMVFLSAALSQTAGLGVTLSYWGALQLGLTGIFASPTVGSAAATFGAVLVLSLLGERRGSRDGILGVVFLLGSAGSLIVGTQIVEELQDIQTLLFGTAVAVLPEDFHMVLGVAVVVTVIHLWWGSGFSAVALDAEGSRVRGMPTRVLEIGLLLTVALTISVTTRVLGALPVFGFSVLPAMAAIRLMPNVPRAMVVAAVIGAICGFGGYVLAFLYSLPVGAMQAMLGVAFVIVASGFGAIGSRLAGSRAGKGVEEGEGAPVANAARP